MSEQTELEAYIRYEMSQRYIGNDNSNTERLIKLKTEYVKKFGHHLLGMLIRQIETEMANFQIGEERERCRIKQDMTSQTSVMPS